jgi:LDH2 family malate/lactate/ureidoglycolate dehydrogenase
MAIPEYEQSLAQLVRKLRSSGELGQVLLPGEASHARKRANEYQAAIPEPILAEIDGLLASLDLPPR